MLTARGESSLMHVRDALRERGVTVEAHPCDAADEAAMGFAFDKASELGPVGALLNNAGVLEPIAPIAELDIDQFDHHMRTNVTGVLVGMKVALTKRNPQLPLRIVNVSSGAATHGYRSWAAYCASKAAVNLLTEVAHAETGDSVSIVAVAPGVIETRMQRVIRQTSEERFPDVGKFHEMKSSGALLHAVDAARALAWLLCDAPMLVSGRFVDARDPAFMRNIPAERDESMARARGWFDTLESE